jgi:hypothetical protein
MIKGVVVRAFERAPPINGTHTVAYYGIPVELGRAHGTGYGVLYDAHWTPLPSERPRDSHRGTIQYKYITLQNLLVRLRSLPWRYPAVLFADP